MRADDRVSALLDRKDAVVPEARGAGHEIGPRVPHLRCSGCQGTPRHHSPGQALVDALLVEIIDELHQNLAVV